MTDHPLRRHSDGLEVMLGRVDERTLAILAHLEKINGRLGVLEVRMDAADGVRNRAVGATEERKRWFGAARSGIGMAKALLPQAGGLAGLIAALYWWGSEGK